MSDFSPDWLALREAVDARARDASAVATLEVGRSDGAPLRVMDLGSGIGANLRFLGPRLEGGQSWLLFDADAELLTHAPEAMRAWAFKQGHGVSRVGDGLRLDGAAFSATIRWQQLDLATHLSELPFADTDLVTASALLDLVSGDWVDALVGHCSAHGCAVLFALTYDGRMTWCPKMAADRNVTGLFNRHQRWDKGFGPALGPAASAYAAQCLEHSGYRVRRVQSDWRLDRADAALQEALARGVAEAATEVDGDQRTRIELWLSERQACIEQRGSALVVGHVDLLALPPSL